MADKSIITNSDSQSVDSKDFYSNFYQVNDEKEKEILYRWRNETAKPKAESILKLTEGLDIHTQLDLGSGYGNVLMQLAIAKFADEVTAVDISEDAISVLKETKIPNLKQVVVSSVEQLPFKDNEFDAATICHVVEHIPDPIPCIREAGRVAKYVVIEVPLEGAVFMLLRRKLSDIKHGRKERYMEPITGHINFYRSRTLRRDIHKAGLTVIKDRFYILSEDQLKCNPTRSPQQSAKEQKLFKFINRYGEQFTARFVSPFVNDFARITHYAVLCQKV